MLSDAVCLGFGVAAALAMHHRALAPVRKPVTVTAASAAAEAIPATDAEAAAEAAVAPPRCVVVLHEATRDRYIHYLLRPATALGAAEVFWVGAMQAKGGLRGTSPYGKAMRREASVPLTSLSNMFQVRRRLTEYAGRVPASLVVIGVVLRAGCVGADAGDAAGPPPVTCLADIDFLTLAERRRAAAGLGAEDEVTLAFLFAGPAGQLTAAQAAECDAIVSIAPSSSPAGGSAAADGEVAEDDAEVPVSAMVAIVLHHFSSGGGGAEGGPMRNSGGDEKFGTAAAAPRGSRAA
jgi:hypothetical protein